MQPSRRYARQTIYTGQPSERVLCAVGDLNGDGTPEIVIGARLPRAELYWLGRSADGTWQRHDMDTECGTLEAGGVLYDVDGDGDLDFIAGQDGRGDLLFWWECPKDPTQPWTRRVICQMPARQSHDQLVADIDGDGRAELYFWNQGSRTLYTVPIPEDPRICPWPGILPVVEGVLEEGLAAADVDGDGRLELIAGQSWYRPPRDPCGAWERHTYATGYVSTRVAAADLDGDGRAEIVLAEGDASLNGRAYGRLALCRPGDDITQPWTTQVLHDRLLDPHSLEIADMDGDGQPDIFVGELGLPRGGDPHLPAQLIYWNHGGRLEAQVISEGLSSHESKVLCLDGRAGVVTKPFRVLRSELPRPAELDGIHLWLQA